MCKKMMDVIKQSMQQGPDLEKLLRDVEALERDRVDIGPYFTMKKREWSLSNSFRLSDFDNVMAMLRAEEEPSASDALWLESTVIRMINDLTTEIVTKQKTGMQTLQQFVYSFVKLGTMPRLAIEDGGSAEVAVGPTEEEGEMGFDADTSHVLKLLHGISVPWDCSIDLLQTYLVTINEGVGASATEDSFFLYVLTSGVINKPPSRNPKAIWVEPTPRARNP